MRASLPGWKRTSTVFVSAMLAASIFAVASFSMISMPSEQSAWPGTFPGVNGKIAFVSFREGNSGIYIMNADGTGQTRLSVDTNNDSWPSWSPNGTKIAFSSERDGNNEIYIMNSDGTDQTRLTDNAHSDSTPSWSPDGTKIVFSRAGSPLGVDDGIFVMNPDGTDETRLTDSPAGDSNPEWSPDGSKISFFTFRDRNAQIYVMNSDGSGQTRLTNNLFDDALPSWSPDGTKIVFSSFRLSNSGIYLMNADGTGESRLIEDSHSNSDPSWSPDGTKIIFSSDRDGNNEISIMNADGTGQTNLSNNAAEDLVPDWGARPSTLPTIETLIADINSMNLEHGVQTSLIAPLKNADKLLNDSNTSNDEAVCGKLTAFTNKVDVKEKNDQLTSDQAEGLSQTAQDIKDSLAC